MEQITFKELILILKRGFKLLIILPTILSIIVGVYYFVFAKNQYTAEAKLYVLIDYGDASGSKRYDVYTSTSFTGDYQQLIRAHEVLSLTAEKLGVKDLNTLKIDVSSQENTRVICLSVTGTDPLFCMNAANTISEVFIEYLETITQTKSVNIASKALIPSDPSGPNRFRNTAMTFIISITFVGGLMVAIANINTKLYTTDDVEKYLDVPVLACIMDYKKKIAKFVRLKRTSKSLFRSVSPDTQEGIKTLAMNIQLVYGSRNVKTLVLTSSMQNEGKSTISVMLASELAEEGNRVLLCDMDFKNPSIGKYLGVRNRLGITDMLNGVVELDKIITRTNVNGLYIIDNRQNNTSLSSLVNTSQYREFACAIRERFDFIIYDAPTVGLYIDSAMLASIADMTLLVIASGRVERALGKWVVSQLQKANVSIGVAINFINAKHDHYGSKYRKYNRLRYTNFDSYYSAGAYSFSSRTTILWRVIKMFKWVSIILACLLVMAEFACAESNTMLQSEVLSNGIQEEYEQNVSIDSLYNQTIEGNPVSFYPSPDSILRVKILSTSDSVVLTKYNKNILGYNNCLPIKKYGVTFSRSGNNYKVSGTAERDTWPYVCVYDIPSNSLPDGTYYFSYEGVRQSQIRIVDKEVDPPVFIASSEGQFQISGGHNRLSVEIGCTGGVTYNDEFSLQLENSYMKTSHSPDIATTQNVTISNGVGLAELIASDGLNELMTAASTIIVQYNSNIIDFIQFNQKPLSSSEAIDLKDDFAISDYQLYADRSKYQIYKRSGTFYVTALLRDVSVKLNGTKLGSVIAISTNGINGEYNNIVTFDNNNFPNLLNDSSIFSTQILPYSRNGKYQDGAQWRLVVITSRGQIYHNFPNRETSQENQSGVSQTGDMLRFDESVVWDMETHRYPSMDPSATGTEKYFPCLNEDRYVYHPALNTDENYDDIYGNGGFGKSKSIGGKVYPRFDFSGHSEQTNSFRFMSGFESDYKISLLGTYISNTSTAGRVCLFASDDGGRQWYCKQEWTTGVKELFSSPINTTYMPDYKTKSFAVSKRALTIPSSDDSEPEELFKWGNMIKILSITQRSPAIVTTETAHGFIDGDVIIIRTITDSPGWDWMCNDTASATSGGNGIMFRVKKLTETTFELYEFTSSAYTNLQARHIHSINRIKDGWIIGTGETYPEGFIYYMQMKESDFCYLKYAHEDFPFIRLTSSEGSIERIMGALMIDDPDNTIIAALDNETTRRNSIEIPNGRSVTVSRSSTGIFRGKLVDIDDLDKFTCIYESREVCYYFKEKCGVWIYIGQLGDLAISFDKGITWISDKLYNVGDLEWVRGENRNMIVISDYIICIK